MPTAAPRPPETLEYFVEGMDCANCVRKVEQMVATLPGAAEVRTSFNKQTLELQLDETQTPKAQLEANLRRLGYAPALKLSAAEAAVNTEALQAPAAPAPLPWYASGQGRLVVVSGMLLALALALSAAWPTLSVYGYVAATLLGSWPLLKKAVASARFGDVFSINLLVSVAAIGAVLIGQAAEGAVVVFLFAVGELLEGVAAGRARSGIRALAALRPHTALLLDHGQVREVRAEQLQIGQQVQVRPGARVPADGRIVAGTSSLDDSAITGESVPVLKSAGQGVYAGSLNHGGVLTVEVEKSASDDTIARILHLVEEAEASKAPTARFIDRFSRAYTPGVVAVAALVAVLPPLVLGAAWHPWLYHALTLLLIGCPCALVLSVPAAITSALSAGARRGLLFKGGAALETIGRVQTVAFDKTGTLTLGRPRLTDVVGLDEGGLDNTEVLRLAAAVESSSNHPLAHAIVEAARERGLRLPLGSGAGALAGRAAYATVEGRALSVTSPRHAADLAPLPARLRSATERFEAEGRTAVVLLDGTRPLGVLALRDEPRPEAAAVIAELHSLGVQVMMLSGDNARTASAIAAEVGLSASAVQAGLLPEDKLRWIARLSGGVAMVGDGINDAPALAQADVGIAVGSGTDVALETADAALLRPDLSGVPAMINLSRATLRNIRQNVAFALGLKAVFLIATLLGYTNLWMAVLADTGATALVTANALRLLGWRVGAAAVRVERRTHVTSRTS